MESYELNKMGFTIIRPEIALKQVRKLTNLKGRWFILSRNPLTICDTGHNAEGIQEVVTQLSLTRYEKLHLVFGVVNDKDIAPILALLPTHAQYYFCHAAIPRALEAETLRIEAAKYQLVGKAYQSVKEALAAARLAATNNDLIFIGGSTFVVAEIIP
jgi:dihydrofolate synthase/folylpolyglutamate synthase